MRHDKNSRKISEKYRIVLINYYKNDNIIIAQEKGY
jgi:hypothetical protein